MALRPCPTCSAQVSDQAPRCPVCGANLSAAFAQASVEAPWPPPPPPRAQPIPGAAPGGIWMRIVLVVAVLFSILSGLAGARGQSGAEGVGYVMGGAMAPFLLAALFLAWTRRTRPYIPALALVFAFFGTLGSLSDGSRAEVDAELSQTRSLMSSLADSGAAAPGAFTPPPRGSQKVRLVWAMNQALAELPARKQEIATRHGVDPDHLPEAWGTSRYMAEAGRHPEVERYWTSYRGYLADFSDTFRGWLEERITTHARTAGVRDASLRGFLTGMGQGAELAGMETISLADSTAVAALEYHRFLASVDARVEYDANQDMAMFQRDDDLSRANALQTRVQSAADALNRAQAAAMRRSMLQVDSLAAQL